MIGCDIFNFGSRIFYNCVPWAEFSILRNVTRTQVGWIKVLRNHCYVFICQKLHNWNTNECYTVLDEIAGLKFDLEKGIICVQSPGHQKSKLKCFWSLIFSFWLFISASFSNIQDLSLHQFFCKYFRTDFIHLQLIGENMLNGYAVKFSTTPLFLIINLRSIWTDFVNIH